MSICCFVTSTLFLVNSISHCYIGFLHIQILVAFIMKESNKKLFFSFSVCVQIQHWNTHLRFIMFLAAFIRMLLIGWGRSDLKIVIASAFRASSVLTIRQKCRVSRIKSCRNRIQENHINKSLMISNKTTGMQTKRERNYHC